MIRKIAGETLVKNVSFNLGGASLTNVQATVTPSGRVVQNVPLGVVPSVVANALVALTLSAGTAGEVYDLGLTLTTDAGETIEDLVQVHVYTLLGDGTFGYGTLVGFNAYVGEDYLEPLVADDYGRFDYDRIQQELVVASAQADTFLQKRYKTPLSLPAPEEVVRAIYDIAYYNLHRHEIPDAVKAKKAAADSFFKDIQSGNRELDLDEVPQDHGGPLVSSPDRIFSAKSMQGF